MISEIEGGIFRLFDCGDHDREVTNGDVICSESRCFAVCHEGYTLRDSVTLECTIDGVWEGDLGFCEKSLLPLITRAYVIGVTSLIFTIWLIIYFCLVIKRRTNFWVKNSLKKNLEKKFLKFF